MIVGNNCGGYYKYTAPAATILNPTIGQWKRIDIPLAGGNPWSRVIVGDVSFDELSYVEIHADTWDFGFELWIDGLTFNTLFTGANQPEVDDPSQFSIYPNPAKKEATFIFHLTEGSQVNLNILDLNGRMITKLIDEYRPQGNYSFNYNVSNLPAGIYFATFITGNKSSLQRLVITR